VSQLLDQSVSRADDGTWTFTCPVTDGSCAPFVSSQWPTKKTATARGQEHFEEHLHGTPMRSLDDFRAEHGLTVNPDGMAVAITAEDLA
jgi:hypothetical protein